jgi:hypothetical protein
MKRIVITLSFLAMLAFASTASAVLNKGLDDAFDGCMTADCVEATSFDSSKTSSSTLCTDNSGCPACTLNTSETWSQCSKISFASGWCRCSNPQTPVNLGNGAHSPVCKLDGSCRYRP